MMMSLSIARRCISVIKQRSHSLHFCPRQVSARASNLNHNALASGSVDNSARSPVLVVFSHAAIARPDDRNKIGQRLSGTRAGFHDQMPLFFERPPDGFGHLKLSSAEFICWMGARKHATGCEELIKRDALVADGRD